MDFREQTRLCTHAAVKATSKLAWELSHKLCTTRNRVTPALLAAPLEAGVRTTRDRAQQPRELPADEKKVGRSMSPDNTKADTGSALAPGAGATHDHLEILSRQRPHEELGCEAR